MNLSKKFTLDELTRSRFVDGGYVDVTHQQIYCLGKLANNILQPIRNKFGRVDITSGVRNKEVFDGLIKEGYPASKTSDHFAWCDINPYGTGAADFTTRYARVQDVFTWIVTNPKIKVDQCIIYPEMNIIHVSNHWNDIFGDAPKFRNKSKYLVYRKATRYTKYEPGDRIE